MKTLEQLRQQKEDWGFLEGQDAQEYLAYIRGTRTDWTEEAQQELTSFMLGLPVKEGYAFETIAGAPVPAITRNTVPENYSDEDHKSIPRDDLELLRISELAPGEKKMPFAAFEKLYSVSGSSKVEAA
jgi:hypothetical protein